MVESRSNPPTRTGSTRSLWSQSNENVPGPDASHALAKRRDEREPDAPRNQSAMLWGINALLAESSGPGPVLEAILSGLREWDASIRASIYRFDRKELFLRPAVESEAVDSDNPGLPVDGPSLAAQVVRSGTPAYIPGPENPGGQPTVRAEYAVPLRAGGMVLGVLRLESDHPEGIAVDTRQLADQFAVQAALALERDALQKKLAEQEQPLLPLNSAPRDLALAVCDLQGTVSAVNAGWSQLFGYSDVDLHGRKLAELTLVEDREEVVEQISQLRNRKIDRCCRELRLLRRSGGIVACRTTLSLACESAQGTSYLLVAAEQVAEQRPSKAEQGLLQDRFRQAQKMEAIGTLAGGIAHDFNNLLGVILGFASLARVRLRRGDPLQESLRMIEQSAERAADLSRHLLAFARPDKSEEMRAVSIEEILERILKIVTQTFDRRIQIRTHLDASLPSVLGDPSMLEQVFLNLCLNARDAISAEGTITIEGSVSALAPGGEEVLAPAAYGLYLRVTVTDTGAGIDPKVLEHIFEPFFTTKGEGEGSGLGLAMVREIVSRHAGFVRVQSALGRGSHFSVYLPVVPRATGGPVKRRLTRVERGSGEVLVVDDEPMVLAFAQKALTRLGYRVLTADNGKEACKVFEPRSGEIDCVLLDMVMPEMGGLETMRRLRGINPRVRVIVSSGYAPDEETRKLVESGAIAVLRKPYSLETLARTLKVNI